LEFKDGLQCPLADFCLVRCVLGVPSWIFKNISQDHTRRNRIIITLADIVVEYQVFSGDFAEQIQIFSLTDCFGNLDRFRVSNGIGDRFFDQIIQRFYTDAAEHLPGFCFIGTYMSARKFVCLLLK
jgi:hypothetical protein